MQSENIYNKDNTHRSCPHGAALSFPVGTVQHVKVDDAECWQCPCYGGCDYSKDKNGIPQAILCYYPKFSPHYGIDYN